MVNKPPQQVPSLNRLKKIGLATAVVAGVFHLIPGAAGLVDPTSEIPQTFYGDAASLVSSFFVALAAFQLIWAGIVWKTSNKPLLILGIIGFLGSVILYIVSVAAPLPFGVPQQPTNTPLVAFPVVTKIIELVFVVSSISILRALPRARTVSP